jgi:hypothetical protein
MPTWWGSAYGFGKSGDSIHWSQSKITSPSAADGEEGSCEARVATIRCVHIGHFALRLHPLDEIEAEKLLIERKVFPHISGVAGDGCWDLRKRTQPYYDFIYKLDCHAVGIVHGEDAVVDLAAPGLKLTFARVVGANGSLPCVITAARVASMSSTMGQMRYQPTLACEW